MFISEVREKLAEVTGRVRFTGERIVVQKHGKTVAVLVPLSDLEQWRHGKMSFLITALGSYGLPRNPPEPRSIS